jgi:hypothetical protein
MNGQLHALAALSKEKELPYTLHRRLGGPQSQSGRFGEERNIWPLPAIDPWFLGRPSRSLVAVPTELFPSISFRELAQSVEQCVTWSFPKAERSESELHRQNCTDLHLRTESFIVRNSRFYIIVSACIHMKSVSLFNLVMPITKVLCCTSNNSVLNQY